MTDKIILVSSDAVSFEIEKNIIFQSDLIKVMCEDLIEESEIPLPNVNSNVLSLILSYCRESSKHVFNLESKE